MNGKKWLNNEAADEKSCCGCSLLRRRHAKEKGRVLADAAPGFTG
jgi:hypothetical protein